MGRRGKSKREWVLRKKGKEVERGQKAIGGRGRTQKRVGGGERREKDRT